MDRWIDGKNYRSIDLATIDLKGGEFVLNFDFNPMNDVLFKFIFGSEERKHITIDFLNAVLEREGNSAIKEIEFRNVEFMSQRYEEKSARLDIFAIIDDKERLDIEVQCINHHDMEKRSLFYWAQMFLHSVSLMKAECYKDLMPAIAINILDFNFLPFEKPHSMYSLYDQENMHRLTDVLEIHFLEVPKFGKKPIEEMSRMEKWMTFFSRKLNLNQKQEIALKESAIKDALSAADVFFMDDKAFREYFARQSAVMDYTADMASARNEGREQGEEKILRLIDALYKTGRQDDITKLYSDKTFRENLYKEFNII